MTCGRWNRTGDNGPATFPLSALILGLTPRTGWMNVAAFGALSLLSFLHTARTERNPIRRAQLRWAISGLSIVVIFYLVFSFLTQVSSPPDSIKQALEVTGRISILLIPLTFGIAILRYRLFDIDLIIRRTLVYSLLTGSLVILSSGSVISLQFLFRNLTGQESQLAIFVSTLIIVGLFQPLRRAIQDRIDGHFYRRKYKIDQAMASFNLLIRAELDLDQVNDLMVSIVEQTLHPKQVRVWLISRE